MIESDFKVYSLVSYEGYAFDGIKMHSSALPELLEKLDQEGVNIVAIKVSKDSVELLSDKPITPDGEGVKLTETIIDRTGTVEAIKKID